MPTQTFNATYDNLSAHAVSVPVFCRRLTVRESASDSSPVAYSVQAPTSSDPVFHKFPAETVVFDAGPTGYFQPNQVVGYIQPSSGTITFELIAE